MNTVNSRRALQRASLGLSAALALACGSSESDDGSATLCTTQLCNMTNVGSGNPSGDPSGDPTGDPTDSGGTTGPDMLPTCSDCAADQVCVQGVCTDVPSMCPCPVETYCNLAENKCVIGCTNDDECDIGRICDPVERECFEGCRDDDGCPLAGHICDAMTCRPGCYTDDECPLEQLCDTEARACYSGCNGLENCGPGKICKAGVCQVGCLDKSWCGAGEICKNDQCVAGCDSSAECGPGLACIDNKCVAGCKVDDECQLGQVCIDSKCAAGCGHPGESEADAQLDRCPLGQSCLPVGCTDGANCSKFECSESCTGACNSSANEPYDCFGDSPGVPGKCKIECSYDGDCAGGEYCAYHTDPPNPDVQLCHSKCVTNADCADASAMGFPFACECWMGMCTLDLMGFPTLCSYTKPE